MLKPRARICSRPSSVIFSGPHGGSQTQLIRKSSTRPPPDRSARRGLVLDHVGQRAGGEVSVMSMVAMLPSSTRMS